MNNYIDSMNTFANRLKIYPNVFFKCKEKASLKLLEQVFQI